jgi:hypothetical protein
VPVGELAGLEAAIKDGIRQAWTAVITTVRAVRGCTFISNASWSATTSHSRSPAAEYIASTSRHNRAVPDCIPANTSAAWSTSASVAR